MNKKNIDMKTYFKLTFLALMLFMFNACEQNYIDPIEQVEPGNNTEDPEVTINFPKEGSEIKVVAQTTTVDIDFEVVDDIEIASIRIDFDGSEIANLTEFIDYRIVKEIVSYDGVEDGAHTITITATDIDGKTSSESVTFEKVPPYTTKYRGEVLYMPFDGDYQDIVSFISPTVVGNPGFAGESVAGLDAYAGAENAYLTIPIESYKGDEFSASLWMKVNADPDRAGILVASAPDEANPGAPNNRSKGFRFFREAAGDNQRFKLNIGTGESDTWFDGGEAADVDPTVDDWVHFAFTISSNQATVYIDGNVVKQGEFDGIDWTNVETLSIMSGAPNFTGWNHFSDRSYLDELRLFNVALTQSEIQQIIMDAGGSVDPGTEFGELFYMPFDGNYVEQVSGNSATEVGSPGYAGEAKDGTDAYAGAADSYLTFPLAGLDNPEFSATFWHKVNSDPDRAGILVVSPPDPDNPEAPNNRSKGFRFFREAAGDNQRFKLNVGTGEGDTWVDGGEAADIDPTAGDWVFMAFTISQTSAKVYVNGTMVKESEITGIDWTDTDNLTIMSGAPNFTGWNHFSDESFMDELRIFDRVLTEEEINEVMNSDAD
jgi:hypothetical protein